MCMQDLWIASRTKFRASQFTYSNLTVKELLMPEIKRYSLVIPPPNSGTLFIAVDSDAIITSGFRLLSTAPPLILNYKDHGDIVQRRFTAIHSAAVETIEVWENLLTVDFYTLMYMWNESRKEY